MSKRDYYEILSVSRTVTDAELKAAYRKLAMQHHPDRNPGDTECEHKFKELNEAYDVLKDGDKRAAYDRFGHAAFEQGGMGGAAHGLGAGAGAGFADHRGRDADLRGLAGKGLFQADFHVVTQIRAALAALPAAAAPAAAHAKQIFENVGECMGKIGTKAVRSPAHAALLEGGVTEPVIGGALVAVLEDVIGLVEFFEFVLAFGVARIAIRMMLHGELAVGGFEFG